MKNIRKVLSLGIVSMMILTTPAFADGKKENSKHENNVKVEKTVDSSSKELEKDKKEMKKEEKEAKKIEQDKLKQEKKEIKADEKALKEEAKKIRNEMKLAMKKQYTNEELQKIEAQIKELKAKYKDLKVLPVENILTKKGKLKFDTPPVIKEGRTLVPVRALSEGFGATVKWNEAEKQITISKDGKEIVLKLGSNIAYVDGKEVKLDVSSESINNRTVVPLRFIIENLGLKTTYDQESDTIQIDENNGGSTESTVTTDSTTATTVTDNAAGTITTTTNNTTSNTGTTTNNTSSTTTTTTDTTNASTTNTATSSADTSTIIN